MSTDINVFNVIIASFDIASLFTNIPVDETIEMISNSTFFKVLIAARPLSC